MNYSFTPQQLAKIQEAARIDDPPSRQSLKRALIEIAMEEENYIPPNVDTLLTDPPDFDGMTCLLCRGNRRIEGCQKCCGSFDNIRGNEEFAVLRFATEERNRLTSLEEHEKFMLSHHGVSAPQIGWWWSRKGEEDLREITTEDQLLEARMAAAYPSHYGPFCGTWSTKDQAHRAFADVQEALRLLKEKFPELMNSGILRNALQENGEQ